MYIKSITIDGFKSYGQRTEIQDFDKLFNAITGLNGSGKSNILDAICFLLGITNLSQVRANNLQELVYKNGQAGISKASVSVVFDNTDKQQSPIGYEQFDQLSVTRQVVIGGRNKYLINGCNAQNNKVNDLFRSVQLNVNNPHFLIMQGRITKVLNMKPVEILSMIEEAAGTKMYETKKQTALKTIAKKEAKLVDINTAIDEEITPNLERLKEERAAYLEYQKVQREIDHLSKLCVAFQFVSAQNACKSLEGNLETMREEVKTLKENIVDAETAVANIEQEIVDLEHQTTHESESTLKELEKQLREQQMKETKASSDVASKRDNLKAEENKREDIKKCMDDDVAAAQLRAKEIEVKTGELEKLTAVSERDAESLAKAQKQLQAISTGLSKNADGQAATLANQLMVATSEIADSDTKRKQSEMLRSHRAAELAEARSTLRHSESSYADDLKAQKHAQSATKSIENELHKLGFDPEQQRAMSQKKSVLQNEVGEISSKVEMLESRFPQLVFDYKHPTPNWDRGRVSGFLCKLFSVKDPDYCRALETSAGGRLYNVVVDTEVTGRELFQKGELKRRFTFLPLNKITSYPISANVLAKAQQLVGKDNVQVALSLIDYEPSMRKAMEYVFGGVLVCKDSATAKRVAYHNDIKKKCVTLDGDVFDPSGVISGGTASSEPILLKLKEMVELQTVLESKRKELEIVTRTVDGTCNKLEKFNALKCQLEIKEREFGLLQERMQKSTHHLQLMKIEEHEKAIEDLKAVIEECKEKGAAAAKKAKEVEAKIKDSSNVRERELKEAEKEVDECNRVHQESSAAMKLVQQELDSLKYEREDLDKGQATYDEQMKLVDKAIVRCEKELAKLVENLTEAQKEVAVAAEKAQKQKDIVKAQHAKVESQRTAKSDLLNCVKEGKLKLQQMEHENGIMKSSLKDSAHQVKNLQRNHEWIAEEAKYFGQPNTRYDFKANDPKEISRRLHKMKETEEKLRKNLNTRAMNMLGKAEEQYHELLKKKTIVENDKKNIEVVIQELDEKKEETLHAAWHQVNKDFCSIFNTLLPGAKAKLVAADGKSVLYGLEIKVAFGDVWKESLNELSGGQRSLVALSLVLAMLLFKPAPIYILDEVDAALDLSHTQNIGEMLKTHFKHSQFIVVSLKDGMFSNANVLFKTKFVDGMSTVSRHEQKQSRR